ncbi:MAG TPA: ABC transporter ATP-binding protein [Candidatus Angelobacter sp.]|nr:ABC transporter ATP-binding protein [Candidatus Angelobacter sp.]
MTTRSTYCVETIDLSYRYGQPYDPQDPDRQDSVLSHISLQVKEGSIYGFLGPNGAGKTTTLRLILGLLRKQAGTISLFGRDFDTYRIEILKKIGSLIETPSVYEHLTATENLRIMQKIYQVPEGRIEEALRLVGLTEARHKLVHRFSLGMKQRLSIGIALLHRPALLILDEPTNGLDPNGIVEIRELLKELNREEGVTILVSSHLLSEVERLVSHVGIVRSGVMIFQGTLDELRTRQQRSATAVLDTSDNPRAVRILIEQVPEARLLESRITLPSLPKDRLARINRQLIEAGIDVHMLGSIENDLETIFMEMVGD